MPSAGLTGNTYKTWPYPLSRHRSICWQLSQKAGLYRGISWLWEMREAFLEEVAQMTE